MSMMITGPKVAKNEALDKRLSLVGPVVSGFSPRTSAIVSGEIRPHMTGNQLMNKVNLAHAFSQFDDHWSPKIAGEINDFHVKLVKFQGDFVWHHHDAEDELFLVVKGQFTMRLKEGDVELNEGEFFIVPKGVEHMPTAREEVWVLLMEPKATLNTGNVHSERTVAEPARLQ